MRLRSLPCFPVLLVLAAAAAPRLSAAAPQELLTTVTRTEHNYGGGTSCNHTTDPCLNVYAPARAIEGRPTVLWIHGGGWSIPESNKDSPFNDLMCTALAAAGGYVVSCDYFLSGYDPCGGSTTGADFVQTIQDIKRVIAWIRGKGTEIYGFPHALVVAGSSAGGHLAAMMAVTQGPGETLFDPDPGEVDYSVDFAILYSPPLDFIAMGCEGIEYPPECVAACLQNPGDPCGPLLCGATRAGTVPPGYPCADPLHGICFDTVFQEALIGERWNPGNPPLALRLQNPGPVRLHDCFDYPKSPAMPTWNPWYDASPLYWVSGDEPPMRIIQMRCDSWVSAQEGIAFAARVNARNADPHRCDVLTFEPPGCLGCRHGAEAFTEAGLADNILQLVRARFR